jgi:hypothetical protein
MMDRALFISRGLAFKVLQELVLFVGPAIINGFDAIGRWQARHGPRA